MAFVISSTFMLIGNRSDLTSSVNLAAACGDGSADKVDAEEVGQFVVSALGESGHRALSTVCGLLLLASIPAIYKLADRRR